MIRLDSGEQLLLSTRRHPLPALGRSAIGFLLTIAAALLILMLDLGGIGVACGLLLLAAATIRLGVDLLRYRRDVVAVTDRRLIHRSGILSISSSETAISRIGDILVEQGPLGRLLNYGDVEIVSGSESGVDRLSAIRGPEALAAALRSAGIR